MHLEEIFKAFIHGEKLVSAAAMDQGLIHNAFVLTTDSGEKYLLQQINSSVFKDPLKLSHNYNIFNQYIRPEILKQGLLCFPKIYYASEFYPFYKDDKGEFWKLTEYIDNSYSCRHFADPANAFEAARAYGIFQHHLYQLPKESLYTPINAFRNLNMRVRALKASIKRNIQKRKEKANAEIDNIIRLEEITRENHQLIKSGLLRKKPTHNDPKPENVLWDINSHQVKAVVDLDTVMEAYIIYDFGDLIRSFCNSVDEDCTEFDKVRIDNLLFEASAQAYLKEIKDQLTSADKTWMSLGVKVVIYMQAIRFLTDYLNGDLYYKTTYPENNLDRCRNQLKLLESYLEQEKDLIRIIKSILKV